jgi:hypothetical protein
MFDELLRQLSTGAIDISGNLASWNVKIFGSLVLIELLLMYMVFFLNPEKIEELPVKFFKLLFYTFVANTLFMFLPQIWIVGWDTVNYLVKIASHTDMTFNPSDLLAQAFKIIGSLFAAAVSDGGWNIAQSLGNVVVSTGIAFGVFFLFVIIIAEVIINYVMWIIGGAMGGIFILLFVMNATRPMFFNYIKYMFGLLFKTLTMFLLLALLTVLIANYANFNDKLGPPPQTPSCDLVDSVTEDIAKCTTAECKSNLVPLLKQHEASCNIEKKKLEDYELKASQGFISRGLILLLTLFIFVLIVKTIPSAMASLVGFGSYDVKGMGQAMGAVAMGAAGAKMMSNTNAGQAVSAGAKAVGGAVGAGVGAAASKVAGGLGAGANALANNEKGGKMGAIGKAAGNIGKGIGGASKMAGKAAGGVGKAAKWSLASSNPEAKKSAIQKIVSESKKQMKGN